MGFSKVRQLGQNRPLMVPLDHKRRGVRLIGATSGVVTAQAGSSMLKIYNIDDTAARGTWAGPMGPTALLVLAPSAQADHGGS